MREFSPVGRISDEEAAAAAGALAAFVKDAEHAPVRLLLAAAQAMHDMTESGDYGTGLRRVLRYHFPEPCGEYPDVCLQAVKDVFFEGKRRDHDWKIYQIFRISQFADRYGAPKFGKLARLLDRYDYLGCDRLSKRNGYVYFGRLSSCCVDAGSYPDRFSARKMLAYLRAKHLEGRIIREDGAFHVRVGSFDNERDAAGILRLLECFPLCTPTLVREK